VRYVEVAAEDDGLALAEFFAVFEEGVVVGELVVEPFQFAWLLGK
jgi:hypothetical protein